MLQALIEEKGKKQLIKGKTMVQWMIFIGIAVS